MITVVMTAPVTSLQYDEITRLANVDSDPPHGLVFHSASETGQGILIVDIWEAEEDFRRFGERLRPAVAQVVGQVPDQGPAPEVYRTHHVIGAAVPVHG